MRRYEKDFERSPEANAKVASEARSIDIFKNIGADKSLSENINQSLLASLFAILLFAIPFLLPATQLLTGTIVNAALILAAILLRGNRPYYLVFLPSLATVASGLLFGPLSFFLFFMMPFIFIGNAILIFSFRALYVSRKTSYFITLIAGAIAKSALLFLSASILLSLSVIPALIANAMGLLQLITALLGGIIAYAALALYGKIAKR